MRTYTWGDTETSGLGNDAGVVEIAWIETDADFNVLNTYRSLINPETKIQFGAMSVHGITESMVADQPTIAQFMAEHGYPLSGPDKVLICHNISFDRRFFDPWMDDDTERLCTLKCARLIYPEAENHKLQTLKYMFDLTGDHDKAHTALEDVTVMIQLAQRMCADINGGIDDLLELQNRPVKISKMPWGMHKNKNLADLPLSYVDWLINKADKVDDNLRAALTAIFK